MALKIKQVDPSVVGQSGSRLAFAVYDGSKLVYKTTRGGGRGAPMYGLREETAQRLLDNERARRARGGKTPKATRSTAKAAPKKKLTRQTLTVASCRSFLEDQGYKVKKKKGSSRKEKTLDEMLEDGDISFVEAVAMGYEENPRKRTRKKQRKAADTLFRGKKGASKFHLKRELAALKRAQESLRLEYNNDLISFDDYRTITDDLSAQMEMIEQELGMHDNPRKRKAQPMRVRSPELLSRAELLRLAKSLGVKKPYLLKKAELVYRVEKLQELEYANKVRAKRGGRPVSPSPFLVDSPKDKRRLKAKRKGLASRAPRDSQGRFKKRKNPRAMRRLR
jgi:hypothetical protein